MTNLLASFGLVFAVASIAACGGDPLDPGAGDDPGSGTSTLYVEGRISGESRASNAQAETDFTTEFSIRIGLNNNPVTTGTVTVKTRFATTSLTYQTDNNNLGRWVGTAANYDEVYRLDIISGANEVRGVVIDGPDLHTIKKPTAGASLDSTIANPIEWDRGETADVANFQADNIDLTIPDTGNYSMPPGALKAEKDQVKQNTLELRRANNVVPAGAVPGSTVTVSVRQAIDVIALPNPLL